MPGTTEESVALDFVDRINSRAPDLIAAALTEDHIFTDTSGTELRGREAMRAAWRAYFFMFPDYRIRVDEVWVRDGQVVLIGCSQGTLSEEGAAALAGADGHPPSDEELQGPAIWTAVIRGGLVAEWRVWPDSAAVRKRLTIGRA